jgi:pimeloyl-ACP methyl ester carboxylesterase
VARNVHIWLVRGDPGAGGLIPDDAAERFGTRIGRDHVLTISGGGHSPMRTSPVETTAAILRALGTT